MNSMNVIIQSSAGGATRNISSNPKWNTNSHSTTMATVGALTAAVTAAAFTIVSSDNMNMNINNTCRCDAAAMQQTTDIGYNNHQGDAATQTERRPTKKRIDMDTKNTNQNSASPSDADSDTESSTSAPSQQNQHQSQQRMTTQARNVMVNRLRSMRGRNLSDKYRVDWKTCLGEGAYGSVHPARVIHTDEKVALKKITKRYTDTSSFCRETDALLRIYNNGGHPNISGLRDMYEDHDHYYLVMDLVSGK